MEKYENIIKIEEIRRLAESKDYNQAAIIIDTMDINRIKNITDLSLIADVFIQNQRYDEALKILNKIYDSSISRRVVLQLFEVAIKSKNRPLAKRYYKEYIELAPEDPIKFIFSYLIKKLEGKPIEEQIRSLENLKKYEYIEEWAYELATLYYKSDMKEECIEECNDIIVWFGTGEYVKRAQLLKGYCEGKVDLLELLKEKEEKKLRQVEEEKFKQVEEEKHRQQELEQEIVDPLEGFFADKNIDYKEILDGFLDNESLKEQLLVILEEIDKDTPIYLNFVISSEDESQDEYKVSFAKAILTLLYKLGYISNNKVGIIDSKILNKIDIIEKRKSLSECSLIIENAPLLDDYIIDKMEELVIDSEQKMLVVLLGRSDRLNQLFENHEQLFLYFSVRIEV